MKSTLVPIVIFASAMVAFGQFGRVIYISPDEKLRAVVIPTKKVDGDFHESRVELQKASGETLALNDHSSPDREHGRGVLHAAWSPDSQFFVYSTTSSGGHVAGHFNTYVFVRSLSRFFELDEMIGCAIVDPDFMLSDSATLSGRRACGGEPESFRIHLADLPWRKKT